MPTGNVEAQVRVGRQPHDAVAAGGRVFVGNEFSDSISVIEGDHVVKNLAAPQQLGGLAATDGEVAVVEVRARKLAVFAADSLQPLANVAAGAAPTHVAGGDGRFYVADTQGNAILVYSTAPACACSRRLPHRRPPTVFRSTISTTGYGSH